MNPLHHPLLSTEAPPFLFDKVQQHAAETSEDFDALTEPIDVNYIHFSPSEEKLMKRRKSLMARVFRC